MEASVVLPNANCIRVPNLGRMQKLHQSLLQKLFNVQLQFLYIHSLAQCAWNSCCNSFTWHNSLLRVSIAFMQIWKLAEIQYQYTASFEFYCDSSQEGKHLIKYTNFQTVKRSHFFKNPVMHYYKIALNNHKNCFSVEWKVHFILLHKRTNF